MDVETRTDLLAGRLRPLLAAELSPDAAGSTALALALLAIRAEAAGAHAQTPDSEDVLARDIMLLPAFITWAQDRGDDDLATLVRRFVAGERASADLAPAADRPSDAARRRARLRELQRWGVDLSLIEITLRQSPTERIANMERQLRLIRQLQQAARAQEREG